MRELALKILQEETVHGFEIQSRLRDDVLDAMVRLVEETKQCSIPDGVGQSEQLKAFLTWLEKEGGSPFIDKDALIGDWLKSL